MSEYKAKSVDEAIAIGLAELNLDKENANIEIISAGSTFKKAVVSITAKDSDSVGDVCRETLEDCDATTECTSCKCDSESCSEEKKPIHENDLCVVDFLTRLLSDMGLDCELDINSTKEALTILIKGPDSSYAIGYRGETLDNLQYLCLLASNKQERFKKKLILDADGYRELRAETLTKLSLKLALSVAESGKAVELEPMNPFERRIIHTALQENTSVSTSSEGNDPRRYVVISPIQKDIYDGDVSSSFKKQGLGKTRSFGNKPKKF